MAKKKAVKKPKRRLRRTARRSLAAVLMITAVVVAAIPVPENAAATENPGISLYADEEPLPYKYPDHTDAGEMKNDKGTGNRTLSKGEKLNVGTNQTYNATVVQKLSDSQYQLDWQYKFFFSNFEGGAGDSSGIISEYNSKYAQDNVTLNPNVIYKYDVIEQSTVTDFFTETSATAGSPFLYTLKRPKSGNLQDPVMNGDRFFNEYFPGVYQEQVAAYAQYDKDLAAWQNNPNTDLTDETKKPKEPEAQTRKINQLNDTQRLKYYCDVNRSSNNSLAGCRLVDVIDAIQNASSGTPENVHVYIPLKIEGQNPAGKFDANGLRYISDASIIGIGNEAFKDTENVRVLTLPPEIKYIGRSAFEHSFIKEISFVNVAEICDYAFKNCRQLTKIDFGAQPTTRKLGVECFYGTAVTEVQFPASVEEIGPGAFAYCESLQKLDFSKISASPARIHDYAFYNDVALSDVSFMQSASQSVNINTVGNGAFAVESGVVGNLKEFSFPSKISIPLAENANSQGADGLGDYVLAGRSNLTKVTMPADFGRTQTAVVPDNTFYNCYNLGCVIFPDDGAGSCGRASYEPGAKMEPATDADGKIITDENGNTIYEKKRNGKGLFRTVSNPDFYVQGPELDSRRNPATPRQKTWDAVTAVSDIVPYLYVRNGLNYYEISNGEYLMCVDNNGILTSCTRKDTSIGVTNVNLVIPAQVGKTDVTGIASDCFSDAGLNNNVSFLKIADDSKIAVISPAAFQGWENLKKVDIGNSVTEIGANAFEGCNKLIDVTFSSPQGGHQSFKPFGENAFKTGSTELTFHGDIVKGYAPFEWAMAKDNIIKEPEGIRVCYQSLIPTFLTVMYDEHTGLVTLLDYPRTNQISALLKQTYKDDIEAGGYKTYEEMREQQSYREYEGEAFKSRQDAFKSEWMEKGTAAYDSENYGPWISPTYIKNTNWNEAVVPPTGGDNTGGGTTGGDGTGGSTTGSAIADFLFEPIVAYAGDVPDAYYEREENKFHVGAENMRYPQLTAEEISLLDAVRNIVVPEGVESIDVYGYINNSESNKNNAAIYLERKLVSSGLDDVWKMYTSKAKQDDDGTPTQPGLFSGYYDDGLSADNGEKYKRGNDLIESVTMNSVKYLPKYAFDSCEKLLSVDLGPACADIGTAPFRGCYEMETVGDNDYYTTTNGIIYSKNTDGSLTIEECLAARGRTDKNVGPAIISSSLDENIKKVSAIRPGAFENCVNLNKVDFGRNDTAGLTEIPVDCFKNCYSKDKQTGLQEVTLPVTVNDIGKGAFVGDNSLSHLTVHGDEVKISGNAFDSEKTVQTAVRAHEDSAVARYVKEYGGAYNLVMADPPLGKQWQVSFYDANYKLIENMVDDQGTPIDNPQYVEDGNLADFPDDPVMEGWTFESWIGLNGATRKTPIREDTIFYAQGHFEGGTPVDGKWAVEFYDGVDGQQLAGRGSNPSDGKYYVDAGKSFADMGWPEPLHPVHAGFEAMGFSSGTGATGAWTAQTVINSNMTVVALYKAATTTSGGSTNTPGGISGGTTSSGTTSNGTTSSNTSSSKSSSSKNSSSSSSSSSSSTSTTSTTSGAGQYTVFVESGSGSGSYAPGTTVIIQAAIPAAGMRFDKWTTESNGVTLASVSMPATTFTMPSNNVTIKANYVEDTAPSWLNTSGTGGGGGSNTVNNSTGDSDDGNTRVDIEKPGISNRDLATANVNGSTDNFIVKISETDEATRAVAAALTNKYGTLDNILYYAMDISLYDSTGTTKITDTTGLSVDITIPIPDSLVAYGGNNMAGAVINGDQLESLNENFTTINGVPCIRFRATHFSPYTIYVDTGNLVEGMLDTTPKTGDPIHPKWFLSLGLACLSMILFLRRDKRKTAK